MVILQANLVYLLGAFALYLADQDKDIESRYVHKYYFDKHEDRTRYIIITCFAGLLALIQEVTSFEGDTAFKRVLEPDNLEMNEWEMVTYYKPVQKSKSPLVPRFLPIAKWTL